MALIYQHDFDRPYTHLRIVAVRTGPAAHTLEVARAEMVWDDQRVWHDAPRSVCLKTAADEGESPLRYTATPLLIAQTLWTPGPPHIVASYDPEIWHLLTRPLLGRVACLDVRRLVQQIWPAAPAEDLSAVMDYLGVTEMVQKIPAIEPEGQLQFEVRQTMALLTTIYTVQGGLVTLLRNAALGERPAWLAVLLGEQAPDSVAQAIVDLAALPLEPGAVVLPDPWAPDDAWAAVPASDLLSLAGGGAMAQTLRHRADAELGRRLREQGGTRQPGLILRRTGRLARI